MYQAIDMLPSRFINITAQWDRLNDAGDAGE
jgi:hypothetical protein